MANAALGTRHGWARGRCRRLAALGASAAAAGACGTLRGHLSASFFGFGSQAASPPLRAPREGLRALVTGANKGIGQEIARLLARAGVNVALGSRDAERGRKACEALRSEEGLKEERAWPVQLDITSVESIEAAKQTVQERFGGLDLLVNNAGMAYKGNTFGAHEAKATIDCNTLGTMHASRAFLPLLRASGADGRLVNVASMAGRLRQLSPELQTRFADEGLNERGLELLMEEFVEAIQAGRHAQQGWSKSMYGLSKLGVIAYTRLLAQELNPESGPVVVCCCPGYCATDMSSWRGKKSALEGADTPAWLALMGREEARECHGKMLQERRLFPW